MPAASFVDPSDRIAALSLNVPVPKWIVKNFESDQPLRLISTI